MEAEGVGAAGSSRSWKRSVTVPDCLQNSGDKGHGQYMCRAKRPVSKINQAVESPLRTRWFSRLVRACSRYVSGSSLFFHELS